MAFLQVVATDIDGTLTSNGQLSAEVLLAVDQARLGGVLVVLVTGRIGSELTAQFPRLIEHSDALVLENGGVAVVDGVAHRLAVAVDTTLDVELTSRGIPFRRGEVLLALDCHYAPTVVELVGQLGLDCQVIRNRGALMVVPTGVTKGTGLQAVLALLNRSPHNVIAIGDAENDVPMLAAAEIGIAVGNAVPSVKAHADEVLEEPDGKGLAHLLNGRLLSGARRWCPDRRWIDVGTFADGAAATVPGSQGRILVTGPAASGKSHVIGLMAERWISAGYGVLIVDPEGDHTQLRGLDNVVLVDSRHYLPEPSELVDMLHPSSSMVVDISNLVDSDKSSYVHRLRATVEAHREEHGFPHWVIYDEAQLLGPEQEARWARRGGYVLSSYAPGALPADEVEASDVIIEMDCPGVADDTARLTRCATIRSGGVSPREFTPAERRTVHTRHRHKYADIALPRERRFYFRVVDGQSISPAATMGDFSAAVSRLAPEALRFHLERGDFSRWLEHTITDSELATEVASWEDELAAHRAAEVERVRGQIVRAVNDRYLDGRGHVGT